MNRTATIRLISAALLIAILLIAAIGLPGNVSSSAGQTAATRVPRPHPSSHLHDAVTVMPIGPHGETLYPRPHPQSHIREVSNQQ